ncbi:MAG: hypothetical protein WBY22_11665, partial [Nitrososphaeraceae archaeon]
RPRPQGHLLSFHCSAPVGQGGGPLMIESNRVHTGDLTLAYVMGVVFIAAKRRMLETAIEITNVYLFMKPR